MVWNNAGLLFCLVLCATALNVTTAYTSSACYGTNRACDYYSLRCNSSNIIRLQTLNVGRKTDSVCLDAENHCNSSSSCCENIVSDKVDVFNLENTYNAYTNCSGRNRCETIQAPWQMMNDLNISSYVTVKYECQKVSDKMPLCGGEFKNVTNSSNYIEVMFDGSVENFNASEASKICRCKVSSKTIQTITITAIDVRLQSYFKAENQSVAKCSSATFSFNHTTINCSATSYHYAYNFLFLQQYHLSSNESVASYITLDNLYVNGQTDSPAMVWISLQAENNNTINVECRELVPADLIPATTTATTLTITSTNSSTFENTSAKTTTASSTSAETKPTTYRNNSEMPSSTAKETISTFPTSIHTSYPATTSSTSKPTTTLFLATNASASAANVLTAITATVFETNASSNTSAPIADKSSGDDDEKQREKVMLAIFIPVAVVLIALVVFLLWLFWRRQFPNKKLNFMKKASTFDVYNNFRNSKILDTFINAQGVEIQTNDNTPYEVLSLPINSVYMVSGDASSKQSTLNQSTCENMSPNNISNDYSEFAVSTTESDNDIVSVKDDGKVEILKQSSENVTTTKLISNDSMRAGTSSSESTQPVYQTEQTGENKYTPTTNPEKSKTIIYEKTGAVLILIDNSDIEKHQA